MREGGERLSARASELRATKQIARASRAAAALRSRSPVSRAVVGAPAPIARWSSCSRRLWLEAKRFDGAAERGMANPEGSLREHAGDRRRDRAGAISTARPQLVERALASWHRRRDRWLARCGRRTKRRCDGARVDRDRDRVAQSALQRTRRQRALPAQRPSTTPTWGYFIDETAGRTARRARSRPHQPATPWCSQHVDGRDDGASGRRRRSDRRRRERRDRARSVRRRQRRGPRARDGASTATASSRCPGSSTCTSTPSCRTADYLLDLANGVTSVREMDGSSVPAAQARAERANRLLIPNLYVAGQILASRPLAWYATVVTTPDAARAAVREQKAAGYEFIKVHNMVRARGLRRDLRRGAAPRDSTSSATSRTTSRSRRPIACGQRTFEHFKGYIDRSQPDAQPRGLRRGDARRRGLEHADVLQLSRPHPRRRGARDPRGDREMRYVPARDRARWLALANEPPKPIQQNVLPYGAEDLPRSAADRRALPRRHRRGRRLSRTRCRASRCTTSSHHGRARHAGRRGARAPRRSSRRARCGAMIARHASRSASAPICCSCANPLDAIANLAAIDGVMVRGIWLPRAALDDMLASIADRSRPCIPRRRAPTSIARSTRSSNSRLAALSCASTFSAWLRYRLEAARISTRRPLFTGVIAIRADD